MASSMKPPDTEPPARRFFQYFQHEITALQQEMAQLEDIALAGGERKDAADHCRDGITRLSNEVKDASSYLPSFDQRTYGEAIKALHEELNKIREKFVPSSRFTFKTSRRHPSALSLSDAAELAAQNKKLVPGYQSPISSSQNSISPSPDFSPTSPNINNTSAAKGAVSLDRSATTKRRSADFNSANDSQRIEQRQPDAIDAIDAAVNTINISHQSQKHVLLPSTPDRSSKPAMLGDLDHCVVDLSMKSSTLTPFASLTIKNVKASLLIGGEVAGASLVSEVENSVIVIMETGQLRLHRCQRLQLYLRSRSRPIIENCSDIIFAKLPKCLRAQLDDDDDFDEAQNMWDRVDDFNWLRPEPSPHWRTIAPEEQVPNEVWTDIVPGGPGWSLNDILKATKVV